MNVAVATVLAGCAAAVAWAIWLFTRAFGRASEIIDRALAELPTDDENTPDPACCFTCQQAAKRETR